MVLKLCRTLWGIEEAAYPEKWDTLFALISAQGYSVSNPSLALSSGWDARQKYILILTDFKAGMLAEILTTVRLLFCKLHANALSRISCTRILASHTQAVELITLGWRSETDKLIELLDKHQLALICQIHTCGGYISEGQGFIYCDS